MYKISCYNIFFMRLLGGLVLVVLLLLSLSMLENIISAPIVTSSQEAVSSSLLELYQSIQFHESFNI